MQKIIIDSLTGLLEKALNVFKIYELKSPKTTPIKNELNPNEKKLPKMWIGVIADMTELTAVYFITVLNKMMETASFMIPSPNTILNNLGYLS